MIYLSKATRNKTYGWPAALLNAVCPDQGKKSWPHDIHIRLESVLKTLRPLEKDIIILRYKSGETLGNIGEAYSLSRERIRQIERDAITWLRNPIRVCMLLGSAQSNGEVVEKTDSDLTEDIMSRINLTHRTTSIRLLDLSNRSYNALDNANLLTLERVCQKAKHELMSLSGLGTNSVMEIEEKLAGFGLALAKKPAPSIGRPKKIKKETK